MRVSPRSLIASCAMSAWFVVATWLPANSALLQVGSLPDGNAYTPDGQFITPTASPRSKYFRLSTGLRSDGTADAAEAVNSALSPDGKTLLVLTSGYNHNFTDTSGKPITWPVLDPVTGNATAATTNKAEWAFVFDVSGAVPAKRQQINIPNTYVGLRWDPRGNEFYLSGGGDDLVYAYKAQKDGTYAPDAGPKLPWTVFLNHNTIDNSSTNVYHEVHNGGILKNTAANAAAKGALTTGAVVAGIDVSKDGSQLFATNLENDSLSYVDLVHRVVKGETHFTSPGATVALGEYPYDVAVKSGSGGRAEKVYVSSQRDDQVVVVDKKGINKVIDVGGGPDRLLLTDEQRRLWVADGNTDSLTEIDTTSDSVLRTVSLLRPGYPYHGGNPNSLAIAPDGKTLFVTLGGENALAVVDVVSGRVRGRIPTGWYPNSVTVSADGKRLWVVNAKFPAGPNPANTRTTPLGKATNTTNRNEYGWALEKAGLLQIPLPIGAGDLAELSHRVDLNNGYLHPWISPLIGYLHGKIKHVIYIVNENRTYDQVLGDLTGTIADPTLNLFPFKISPNHHHLATDFVTLDNFYDPGESSGVGWDWTMEGFDTNFVEQHQSVDYGNGGDEGLTYDYQGTNRNTNVSFPIFGAGKSFFDERLTTVLDPSGKSTILPGPRDVGAPYNANNDNPAAIGGYIFDSVLRAGGTVRNYGWQIDQTAYGSGTALDPPLVRHPYENKAPQSAPQDAALNKNTDIYYRGFDQRYPDVWRIEEWQREFESYLDRKNLPTLEVMTVPHDHFGSFGDLNTKEGLNTPFRQFADNDYALAMLVQSVSNSPYWKDTAIFIVEDDSQNGPDHIDSHRSTGYVISAYTKRGAIIHTPYTTENVLATIEALLGVRPVSFHDANASPLVDAFTSDPDFTPYTPWVPGILCGKGDPPANAVVPSQPPVGAVASDLLGFNNGNACGNSSRVTAAVKELHDGSWWAAHTVGYDFTKPDKVDSSAFNRLLWLGLQGDGG